VIESRLLPQGPRARRHVPDAGPSGAPGGRVIEPGSRQHNPPCGPAALLGQQAEPAHVAQRGADPPSAMALACPSTATWA
jgi:hypothetical protein